MNRLINALLKAGKESQFQLFEFLIFKNPFHNKSYQLSYFFTSRNAGKIPLHKSFKFKTDIFSYTKHVENSKFKDFIY